MPFQFALPGHTVMGENALAASEAVIKSFGKKTFIVSGKIVTKSGAVKRLTDSLEKWDIDYVIFNDITGEPTDEMIKAGVQAYAASGCDFITAIGGGSPLDSAKAIAAMSVLPGSVSDYMGKEIEGDFPPVVMIPTTAGTGSEATKFTVITDTGKGIKMLLKGNALLPQLAIVDSSLTLTAPPDITAATGMDALTHAVESYTSRKANDLTDIYALDAVKRIFAYLPAAYKDGNDTTARYQMAVAAYEAGVCINNASVTLVHGMSRPIGALFHVPHGISNAMLIKEALSYVRDGCPERFAALARAIGAADAGTDDEEASLTFINALERLCQTLKIPTLEAYGIEKEEFDSYIDKMARDAITSGSPSNTIKDVQSEDLKTIYQRLWQ